MIPEFDTSAFLGGFALGCSCWFTTWCIHKGANFFKNIFGGM